MYYLYINLTIYLAGGIYGQIGRCLFHTGRLFTDVNILHISFDALLLHTFIPIICSPVQLMTI